MGTKGRIPATTSSGLSGVGHEAGRQPDSSVLSGAFRQREVALL